MKLHSSVLPLTWAAEGGTAGGGDRTWGPAGGGVQWAGCGVWGWLGPQLLRLGLLACLRASLSLWGRKQNVLSRNAVVYRPFCPSQPPRAAQCPWSASFHPSGPGLLICNMGLLRELHEK